MLTKLRRTCSIISVGHTVCGMISKEHFLEMSNGNSDFKSRLHEKLHSYKDSYMKFLVTMVRNVFAFRSVHSQILRNVVYELKEEAAAKGTVIIRNG